MMSPKKRLDDVVAERKLRLAPDLDEEYED
jgi:hypothetical protein